MTSSPPPPPERSEPSPSWEHYGLYRGVREAIAGLPAYFRTETFISGVEATDIHTLNTVLGATIEAQVVQTLNAMRMVWDPEGKYALYSFIRQAQTFPDVVLRRSADSHPLLGVELKGWYLLAKEGEPSFRYVVTPAACAEHDLLVVVPWALAHVLSGPPIVFEPFVESARYAAEYRNYHWQHLRKTTTDTTLTPPVGAHPYPGKKGDQVADVPASDKGNNFGRVARSGVMDEYRAKIHEFPLCGVQIGYWLMFFKSFQESKSEIETRERVEALRLKLRAQAADDDDPLLTIVEQVARLVDQR